MLRENLRLVTPKSFYRLLRTIQRFRERYMGAGKFRRALPSIFSTAALYVRPSLAQREPVAFPGELFQDPSFPQKAEESSKIDALGCSYSSFDEGVHYQDLRESCRDLRR